MRGTSTISREGGGGGGGGGVDMHLVASCHKKGDKVRQVWAIWIEAKRVI